MNINFGVADSLYNLGRKGLFIKESVKSGNVLFISTPETTTFLTHVQAQALCITDPDFESVIRDRAWIMPDSARMYHGILCYMQHSEAPNCTLLYRQSAPEDKQGKLCVVAMRDILFNEELTIDYRKNLDKMYAASRKIETTINRVASNELKLEQEYKEIEELKSKSFVDL